MMIVALLLYPGLLLALALGWLYAALTESRDAWRIEHMNSLLTTPTIEGLAALASMLCVAAGLALLPWPLHPAASSSITAWVWAWAAFEAAFLIPLLPALLTGWPPVVRAAIREVQIGVVGRMVLWLALVIGLLLQASWDGFSPQALWTLPAYALVLIAAYVVVPAAIGWGPFGAETSVTGGGVVAGLDAEVMALDRMARNTRTAALLVTTVLALVPVGLLPDGWLYQSGGVVLLVAVFVGVVLLMERFVGQMPRHTLPQALSICWWRGLPAGLAALMYLTMV